MLGATSWWGQWVGVNGRVPEVALRQRGGRSMWSRRGGAVVAEACRVGCWVGDFTASTAWDGGSRDGRRGGVECCGAARDSRAGLSMSAREGFGGVGRVRGGSRRLMFQRWAKLVLEFQATLSLGGCNAECGPAGVKAHAVRGGTRPEAEVRSQWREASSERQTSVRNVRNVRSLVEVPAA